MPCALSIEDDDHVNARGILIRGEALDELFARGLHVATVQRKEFRARKDHTMRINEQVAQAGPHVRLRD